MSPDAKARTTRRTEPGDVGGPDETSDPAPDPAGSDRRSRWLVAAGVVVASALVLAGVFGFARRDTADTADTAQDASGAVSLRRPPEVPARSSTGRSIAGQITMLEERVTRSPEDHVAWATLGLAYVQQAGTSADPTLYGRAEAALDRSFEINEADNFLGYAGRASLAGARHRFAEAKQFALDGLAINEFSPLLYGSLSDAETQLGEYAAAADHVQRMVDLAPDTSSFARASYTWELRGDTAQATELMERARAAAPTSDDKAFALSYLGELAFDQGDVDAALGNYLDALEVAPDHVLAEAGRAKALAATGQIQTALDAYARLVERLPEPGYLVPYGRLLESQGRIDEAEEQYRVAGVAWKLYEANGVEPDADQVLFAADKGDPKEALRVAEIAVAARPFLAVQDAYAWALYRNGRYDEALRATQSALQLGTRSARFHFHAGMIHLALGAKDSARDELSTALEINPTFDPIDAGIAATTLAELGTQ